MKKLIFLFCLFCAAGSLAAQQDPMFTKYMFNSLIYANPAYAGTHEYGSLSVGGRKQWAGIEGAPLTSMLAFENRILDERVGLGLTFTYDKIGIDRTLILGTNYAYRMEVGRGELALGLSAGLVHYHSRVSLLGPWTTDDPAFANAADPAAIFQFGAGVQYHEQGFFVGFAAPRIYANDTNKPIELTRHYYGYGGYNFELPGLDVSLIPSLFARYEPSAPFQADINLRAQFQDVFSAGVTYRTDQTFGAMFQVQVLDNLLLGYAYDITTSQLRRFSSGTHEVTVGYLLGQPFRSPVDTPRFFF
ncbi:MAG: type IX secretion system membrane protein PorP/SprF [Phaeodactylibacter sp.]|nr:type IX secretion system membrane protein PorP/SprF [Phaeodactylibacter sp.]MCB9293422.1 type IX secretion system membrane protein PorP/SprF [Lewinellaceae bacterium]